eukprot:scaffold69309_cov65-Phaeocystis_antarctica.AAC.15
MSVRTTAARVKRGGLQRLESVGVFCRRAPGTGSDVTGSEDGCAAVLVGTASLPITCSGTCTPVAGRRIRPERSADQLKSNITFGLWRRPTWCLSATAAGPGPASPAPLCGLRSSRHTHVLDCIRLSAQLPL